MFGLEGIVVGETTLSEVDGAQGRLIIRGRRVEDLARSLCFEEVCELLWRAERPVELGAARALAFERLSAIGDALDAPDAMDGLRAATAHLGAGGDTALSVAERVVGAMAVFATAWWRKANGLAPIQPDPDAEHADDLLRMLTGTRPTAAQSSGLNAYLAAVVDHGMNASTFAARVVASTQSDMVSALVAGLGALKGPLHGGAPGPVLTMLDAIGSADNAVDWLEAELVAGRRIMGMGHRVYRVRDPRAAVLEVALDGLSDSPRRALARAVEEAAQTALAKRYPDRSLCANVEFYTAVLLEALGVPRQLFTALFACSRAAGWAAHVMEQWDTGRLIRPRVRYVGARPV